MKFKEMCKNIKQNVQEKGSKSYSKNDLVGLTHTALNDVDMEFTEIKIEGDKPVPVVSTPTKKFRESIEPVLVSAGLDKQEAKEVAKTVEFPKKTAEAMVELNTAITKSYLDTGRKYTLPMTSVDETKMSFVKDIAKEKIEDTKGPSKDPDTGKITMKPTGKTVKTSKREVLKAKNVVPPWLKEEI